ncbi:MAG: YggS family pyridoxal phosphate-dependent enzyme [Sphingobacteriales bacterium]|nr:MAG: YggS family pyridoxal phosphate-dependent enzyme [Sphingobacteriales bacterium]
MAVDISKYHQIREELAAEGATLVAVSKTKPLADIQELYDLGQRDFGENYVQELVEKQAQLPADIRWHFIGHLQSNKVRYIAPFVHQIHGVDSAKLLREISKQGQKAGRTIDALLQVHIAREETKFGLDADELAGILNGAPEPNVRIRGLMGMASFSDDQSLVRSEFSSLSGLFKQYRDRPNFDSLSMGMSGDYRIALEEGSNLVRIGSLLFGSRN